MDRLSQNPTIAPATSEIPLRKFHPTSSIRPFSLWIYGKLLRTFPQPPQARRRLTTFDQDLTPQIASADTGCSQSRWRYRVSVLGDATEYEEPPLALLASAMG